MTFCNCHTACKFRARLDTVFINLTKLVEKLILAKIGAAFKCGCNYQYRSIIPR